VADAARQGAGGVIEMPTVQVTEEEVQLLLSYRASNKVSKVALMAFAASTSEYQQAVDEHGEAGPLLNFLLRNPDCKLNPHDRKVVVNYLRNSRQGAIQSA